MVVLFPLSGDLGERGRLEDVKQEVEPITSARAPGGDRISRAGAQRTVGSIIVNQVGHKLH